MNWKNLKIGTKLAASFGLVIVILLSIGVIIVLNLNTLGSKRKDMINSYKMADYMSESKNALTSDTRLVMEVLASKSVSDVDKWWTEHTKNVKTFDEFNAELINYAEDNSWGSVHADDKNKVKNKAEETNEEHNNIISPKFEKLVELKKKQLDLDKNTIDYENIENEISKLDEEIDNAVREMIGNFVEMETTILTIVNESRTDLQEYSAKTKNQSIILVTLGAILSVILSILIVRSITRPITSAVNMAREVAKGNLTATVDINQKDEIGILVGALNEMVINLKNIVAEILSGADNISSASEQMSSTSQEMSQSSSEQASSVEEVSSSMEQMAANIEQNNENAQGTEKIALNAASGIKEGSEASNTAVKSMKDIAEKITIINDIAFQTNILALNAAVEAARAGEHGKGFAVVAAEVRKLAERSKVAAEEIDNLSRNGVDIAEKAGKKLSEIVPEIEKTAQLVQEISSASIEQKSGADQINSAMQQLNDVTQQNATASEELATGAEELSSQAEQLKDLVGYFKTGNNTFSPGTVKRTQKVKNPKISTPKLNKNKQLTEFDTSSTNDEKFENF